MLDPGGIERLERVIAMTVAPAFLLGGIAAFTAVMIGRMNSIIDRSRSLNAIAEDDPRRGHLRADIPRLARRAHLVNRAILLAIGSALSLTLLVVVSFVCAFFGIHHAPVAGVLFLLAVVLLTVALIHFAREVRLALRPADHHP